MRARARACVYVQKDRRSGPIGDVLRQASELKPILSLGVYLWLAYSYQKCNAFFLIIKFQLEYINLIDFNKMLPSRA